eukprot:TRINITY_DN15147_c0_g2_i1.p1 TRINITY_DN15147_c0_g2~~TRINITY_DN15147_c0_g2_i1.p1  ORF type:complete len:573 (+),score=120.22 TRINITY_DN15147_c0_g2_i1:64-1782(+)
MGSASSSLLDTMSTVVTASASCVKFIMVPDIAKTMTQIQNGHFNVVMLQAPDAFLPNNDALAGMKAAEKSARNGYWVSFMICEYVATVAVGTLIMVCVPPLKDMCRKMRRGSYQPVLPHPEDGFASAENQTRAQRIIMSSSVLTTLLTANACTFYSLQADSLSKKFGLDWELYAGLLTMNCAWMLVQAGVATSTCKEGEGYEVTAFPLASLSCTVPTMADTVDTTKDAIFAGLCLRSESKILQLIGVSSLAWLLAVHAYFLRNDDLVVELTGSYAGVMYANKKTPKTQAQEDLAKKEEEEKAKTTCGSKILGKIQSMGMQAAVLIFNQTTPGKRQVIVSENAPQALAAVAYLYFEGGSPLVATMNLGLPVAQWTFAYSTHFFWRGVVRDSLFESCNNAFLGEQFTKAKVLLGQAAEAARGLAPEPDEPPLFWAVRNGMKDITELLCSKGADVKGTRWEGNTPLLMALIQGVPEVAEVLIRQGKADVNAKNDVGRTPLHKALNKEIAELLILKGAEINAQNEYGSTPLHLALNEEIAELLINEGADKEAKNNGGETPSECNKHVCAVIERQGR